MDRNTMTLDEAKCVIEKRPIDICSPDERLVELVRALQVITNYLIKVHTPCA